MIKYTAQGDIAAPIKDVCEWCDGWGVIEGDDMAFCKHCVKEDLDAYYNWLDEQRENK